MSQEKYKPTPEEQSQSEKSRTLSDAELLKDGAEYKVDESGEKRLEVTREQYEGVWRKMRSAEKQKLELKERSLLPVGEDFEILLGNASGNGHIEIRNNNLFFILDKINSGFLALEVGHPYLVEGLQGASFGYKNYRICLGTGNPYAYFFQTDVPVDPNKKSDEISLRDWQRGR